MLAVRPFHFLLNQPEDNAIFNELPVLHLVFNLLSNFTATCNFFPQQASRLNLTHAELVFEELSLSAFSSSSRAHQ
jgi:hypothetical protein